MGLSVVYVLLCLLGLFDSVVLCLFFFVSFFFVFSVVFLFFFQAEDGIRDLVRSRGLGDVYKRQLKIHFHLVIKNQKPVLFMKYKPYSPCLTFLLWFNQQKDYTLTNRN